MTRPKMRCDRCLKFFDPAPGLWTNWEPRHCPKCKDDLHRLDLLQAAFLLKRYAEDERDSGRFDASVILAISVCKLLRNRREFSESQLEELCSRPADSPPEDEQYRPETTP